VVVAVVGAGRGEGGAGGGARAAKKRAFDYETNSSVDQVATEAEVRTINQSTALPGYTA
jgi:hypothetical protein